MTSDLRVTDHAERALPQWLTGIIAVAGFLFLGFIVFLVNKAWCGGQKRDAVVAMTIKPTCSAMTDVLRYTFVEHLTSIILKSNGQQVKSDATDGKWRE